MDKHTIEQRSYNMSRIKSKNTSPEIKVRKLLWSMGYRYRLNVKKLPGKPDVYIPRVATAVFIHGCFWHQHEGCKRNFMPKSRIDYWKPKLERNTARFAEQRLKLTEMGIYTIVIWECEAKKAELLIETVQRIQNPQGESLG